MDGMMFLCCFTRLLISNLPHYRFFHCPSVATLLVMHQHMTTIPKGFLRSNLQSDKGENSIFFSYLRSHVLLFLVLGFYLCLVIGVFIAGLVKIFIICLTKSILGNLVF